MSLPKFMVSQSTLEDYQKVNQWSCLSEMHSRQVNGPERAYQVLIRAGGVQSLRFSRAKNDHTWNVNNKKKVIKKLKQRLIAGSGQHMDTFREQR